MQQFEDLKVWEKSKDLFIQVHSLFNESKDYYLRNQILRAALSISNNIAKGFERKTQKEFAYFFYVHFCLETKTNQKIQEA